MTIWVYTGGRPSNGAKELASQPGFKRCLFGKGLLSKDILVNWGAHELKIMPGKHFRSLLNHPDAVNIASNKLLAFAKMTDAGIQCVPWCRPDQEDVLKEWCEAGATIIGRQTLTGHSGHGIIIMEKGEELQPAKLYTKYIFKTSEYRVHVMGDKVIDTQKKIRDPDQEPLSWKIRSHENGFIFTRNSVSVSRARDDLAVVACRSLGLDFGAVDVIEDKHGELYILEVNTAPGLEGQTINSYAEAFRQLA